MSVATSATYPILHEFLIGGVDFFSHIHTLIIVMACWLIGVIACFVRLGMEHWVQTAGQALIIMLTVASKHISGNLYKQIIMFL